MTTVLNNTPYVFLSYSHNDRDMVACALMFALTDDQIAGNKAKELIVTPEHLKLQE